jgi:type IV secretory pathway VirB10-like protein
MVSKDQALGGLICAVCVIVGVAYTVALFGFGIPDLGNPLGNSTVRGWTIEFWLIAIPVFIAFIAIMGIGAWIGWTMATTPPPKPIEEITSEIEEKKEEVPPPPKPEEEAKPPETAPPSPAEEKKPERKKKT